MRLGHARVVARVVDAEADVAAGGVEKVEDAEAVWRQHALWPGVCCLLGRQC